MRLDLPFVPPSGSPPGGPPGTWHPLVLEGAEGGDDGDEPGARYFERRDESSADRFDDSALPAAPCLLTISPLLPLPRSLPALLQEALASEPDFRPDWKWPVLTPRVGPWELVVQLCVGTSQATGITTGRLYVALDAGCGAYLIVCIDRDPQKIAERQKEILGLLAKARLHRDRVREIEPTQDPSDQSSADAAGGQAAKPAAANPPSTEIVPPQQPPLEIYLRETLFSYLTD